MRKSTAQFLSIAFVCLCNFSCKHHNSSNVNEESQNDSSNPYSNIYYKSQSEFDSDTQGIYYKEYTDYDIRGEISTPFNTNRLGCELHFFNYGDDIRLFMGCRDDMFITGIGTINTAYVLSSEDEIINIRKENSPKYGEWATVDVTFGDYIANEVFMTPLATNAYYKGEKSSLVLIQFLSNSYYLNALFYANSTLRIMISEYPDFIIHKSYMGYDIESPKDGPGRFWHNRY